MSSKHHIPRLGPAAGRNAAALDFINRGEMQMLIDGRWITATGNSTFDVVDPSTAKLLCVAAAAAPADVDLAVAAARRAFEAPFWATITPYQRAHYLFKIADVLEQRLDELATIQSYDMGMLISQSRWMVGGAAEVFRYYAGWITKIFGRTFPSRGPGLSYTVREPLGVVAAIIPWNGPSGAAAWKIAPALACGNTVILKPAEQAPLVCLRMAELIQETGLPPGVLNVVTGAGEVGAALVAHKGVDKISFTGSTEVGKRIVAAGAATMKRVTVELGGKSPTIIFPDADLDKAVPTAVMAFTIAAGQGCVAGSRVLIHKDIYPEVVERIVAAVRALKVGGAFDAGVDIPAVVSREQLERIRGYISLGTEQGAHLLIGGDQPQAAGYFVKPVVFGGVTCEMRIAQEEIFGPVGALIAFADTAEAIRIANDVTYGLSASIWTKSIETAQTVSAAAKAGIVWVNTMFELDMMAPFGGYKESGIGRELGPDSIDSYTQTKTVVLRF